MGWVGTASPAPPKSTPTIRLSGPALMLRGLQAPPVTAARVTGHQALQPCLTQGSFLEEAAYMWDLTEQKAGS